MWGIEYGWLKKKHPELKLEALVSVYVGKAEYNVVLLVSQAANYKQLADLGKKRLARYNRQPPMVEYSLENMLRENNLKREGFFQEVGTRYPTPQDAVWSIRRDKADCVLMDEATWGHLKESHPGIDKQVVVLRRGPPLPPGVLIGRRENLEKLRHGLWENLQAQFDTIHGTAEGKQCVNFWLIQGFKPVDKNFEDLVKSTGRNLLQWSDGFYDKPK
jgi:ABC-type phosphate/phosphonate transport system substrate-binding protein